ncbi:hypothetical protein N8072_01610 [bacterium]|nr:hypothetical protein [bacterium]MDB4128719.1 hypothetical protein [bacterium]MDC1257351.1 hypothetical protein [bacterium]
MANLVSPGVQVSIVDESVYGSAGAGTVPMLFIATGANKADPTGTETIAKYTKPEFAGKPVLVTSQRELTQFFGNTDFRTVSGTVQQADETNDYGLLAAYSFLGQASAAYVVRADLDLTALRPQASEPTGPAAVGTKWLNPSNTDFGIFEYTANGWSKQTPSVELTTSNSAPTTTVVDGTYLVAIDVTGSVTSMNYFKGVAGSWDVLDAGFADDVTFAPHYSEPTSPTTGDVWVKITTPGSGVSVDIREYTTAAADFVAQAVLYTNDSGTAPTGISSDIMQDGSAGAARSLNEGDLWLSVDDGSITIKRYASGAWGNVKMATQTAQPTGNPVDGSMWFDADVDELAIYEVALDGGVQKWKRATNVAYSSSAPAVGAVGDYWIDTDAAGYPVIYRSNSSAWVKKDNTDQSTSNGVAFGDITDLDQAAGTFLATELENGPNPLIFPVGTTGINMCRSGGTVRVYDSSLATAWKWRNLASNQANGAGSFGASAQRAVAVNAMQASASSSDLREDNIQFRLIAAPGYPEMFDEMTALNADRNETAFVIVDTPLTLAPSEAVAWVQGTNAVENGVDGLVGKNTYAATYYPSVLATDPTSGASVVAPASHSILYTYAYNDNVSFQWFAPAGLTRGSVQNASNVGYVNAEGDFVPVSLSQGSRDTMYEAKLNPIARFPAEGIVVFGQKTLAAGASALDRVNVARLSAYLRERFEVIARPYLFEPNDEGTRKNVKGTFVGFMGNILSQRGVYDFAVACDESNNTPARIDRNELWVDVAIEPTKSAEFIYIPVRIVNTGEL